MLTVAPERETPVRRQRRGSGVTRQHILAASVHLFAKKGFAETTVRDIARRAGITDAAIYYHFATKEDLLREILNTHLLVDDWTTTRRYCTTPHRLMQDVVRGAVLEITRTIGENHELLRIILREGLAGNQAAACRYGQLLDDWESRLASHLVTFESTEMLGVGEARPMARQIMYAIIMAFEDGLLRPNRSLSQAQRKLQTLACLSRHIERLLPLSLITTKRSRGGRRGVQVSPPV